VLSKIGEVLATLRPLAKVRWSPVANLHITTKFIGEWPENRLSELTDALGRIERAGNIRIWIGGYGFLPDPRHPKIFLVGIDGGEELPSLALRTDKALQPLGCVPENRPYQPHLTLARIRKGDNVRDLRGYVIANSAANGDAGLGCFDATDFHLYLSRPGPAGSVYEELATWGLS
jgi:2'-5' RNA ligase